MATKKTNGAASIETSVDTLDVSPSLFQGNGGSTGFMPAPMSKEELRSQYIEWLARDLLVEICKKEGKIVKIYAQGAVEAATELADLLGK